MEAKPMIADGKLDDEARKRITQVFRFLEELNRRRNPVVCVVEKQYWMRRLADLPIAPSVQLGQPMPTLNAATAVTVSSDEDCILRVGRSKITDVPAPPELLLEWLCPGWDNPYKVTGTFSERNQLIEGETVAVNFTQVEGLSEAFTQWNSQREAWVVDERPARDAQKLFEDLYALHGHIGRESERFELVLGDGVLHWRRPEGMIQHPILLQRVELCFDAQKPEFTIRRTDQTVELYSALFRGMSDIDGTVIGKCRTELEQEQHDPLDGSSTTDFLRRLVTQLSPRGDVVDSTSIKAVGNDPIITRDPIIFLRSRTLGYAAALEAILTDLRQSVDLPSSLKNVVGVEANIADNTSIPPQMNARAARPEEQVLLSKPANQEQIEIAQRLAVHGCVLVQGPPGTGKTHTIANLIGHLLAQGKSILVTSHTTKALRVLRDQVVPQLQPLCVSVLEGSEESRQQLESSVSEIVARLANTDAERLTRQSENLADARQKLQSKRQSLVEELQRGLSDEYRDVVIAGRSFSPSDAARKIAQEADNNWIPSPLVLDYPLPLTPTEVLALYRTNETLTPKIENELSEPLLLIEELPHPAEFARLCQERQRLAEKDKTLSAELWQSVRPLPSPEEIVLLLNQATEAVTLMNHGTAWQCAAIAAGRDGELQRKSWNGLLALIHNTEEEAAAAYEFQMRLGPVLAANVSLDEQIKTLTEIVEYLQKNKSLSWFVRTTHAHWNKLIPEMKVGTQQPTTLEHFHALKAIALLNHSRQQLSEWWNRQMVPLGATPIHDLVIPPEQACRQYQNTILEALNWYQSTWSLIEIGFQRIGFHWSGLLQRMPPRLERDGDLLRLRDAVLQHISPIFQSRISYSCQQLVDEQLAVIIRRFDKQTGSKAAPIVSQLRAALVSADAAAYHTAYERLVELHRKSVNLALRHEMLRRLEVVAPTWAAAIRDRKPPHHLSVLPGDAEQAWIWRQLNDELDRRSQVSLDMLQQTLSQTGIELQETTAELVDRLAWSAQVRRTSLTQRQALTGWLGVMKRIGKGTGKRVPKLQAEAKKLMAQAQSSVPVWIMPLARVVESFNPAETRFDVVIIDEASQSDVMGLIAFYMGKQIVIVGDDEQVSPDAVGQDQDEIQRLIDEHLPDIPNAILYDGKQSIYDLALRSFGGTICLREHFRCVSDIIQFSNRLSYQGKIKPLRDESTIATTPYVVEYRVEGATSNNKTNEREALAITSLLVAATEQPEYADQSIGVISLVGDEQSQRIDTLLRQKLAPIEYEQRRIVCGTPPQFQGDERDVMFLSVVDGPQFGPLRMRAEPLFKKRFNVAASRARNQMWVVHSLNAQVDLKPGDLRRALIEHARNPHAFEDELHRKEDMTDSDFECQVLRRLTYADYHVVPQWKVGAYRIDLVVEGNGKRLAVECDGDRFHTMDNLADDMQRQEILERLGWTFVRIRGSEFYRNPDKAMIPVFHRLNQMGISPQPKDYMMGDVSRQEQPASELYNRVVRRAAQLRQEWNEDLDVLSVPARDATGEVTLSLF